MTAMQPRHVGQCFGGRQGTALLFAIVVLNAWGVMMHLHLYSRYHRCDSAAAAAAAAQGGAHEPADAHPLEKRTVQVTNAPPADGEATGGESDAQNAQGASQAGGPPSAAAAAAAAAEAATEAAAAAAAEAGFPAKRPTPLGNETFDDIRLFVGVLSRGVNAQVRQAVRDTWGSDPRLLRVAFFVLRPLDAALFRAVREEAVDKGDVVVVSGTYESYRNTSYSVLEMFRAAAADAGRPTHMLKTDDDCYVRVTKVLRLLAWAPKRWMYAGYPMMHQKINLKVFRDPQSRWYVPYDNWPSDDPVPTHSWGMGTILSIDLVKHIAAGAPHVLSAPDNLMWIEDVAVGIWVDYVIAEQNQVLHPVRYPMNQTHCVSREPIAHFGWLDPKSLPFKSGESQSTVVSILHRCIHSLRGRCFNGTQLEEWVRMNPEVVAGINGSSSGSGGGGSSFGVAAGSGGSSNSSGNSSGGGSKPISRVAPVKVAW